VDASDLAYIMFTSGSTGRPKGVPIRQHNISAYLEFIIGEYEIGPDCRLSHTFGMAFDASVYDMFCAWGAGAALVVPDRKDLHNPVDYITRRGLTHWHSVPSLVAIAQGLGKLPLGRATGLRHSVFGGERVSVQHCELWREVAPNSRIHNNYGPTETTITASAYTLPEDRGRWPATPNDSVPIGAVHRHLESLIVGAESDIEGELCIRGPQRFDGYLDANDNVGRFLRMTGPRGEILVDPAEPVTAEHWYRTGDRVRATPDGLVHLGRLDDQVKIAGYRMEPSEIEAAACRFPEVTQAVAVAVPGAGRSDAIAEIGRSEPRLSLFYTGRALDPGEFARRLREVLPRQMVPRTFHHVEAIPLNVNGKVDRRALAARLEEPR
jgi:non-ribosomal peptide synthetase component F